MKQLGILDSAFINLEHPNTPQHIGGFGIYDPSTAPGGFVRFKELISHYEQLLSKMPVFRTRLVEVPLGLDKPYWVIDENFDVEFHLRHISLPKPGDWRQLCIQIARLHARPLDMSRPLWECYVIEGLDNIPNLPKGAFSIYTKMHHSLVDGAGSQSFMSALHDLEPNPPAATDESLEVSEADEQAEAEFAPVALTAASLSRDAIGNNLLSSYAKAKGAVKLVKDIWNTAVEIKNETLPVPPIGTPKTRFDNPVGPHRVFDAVLFKLDELKAIRKVTGTTVNDVAVAIISGALRRYLDFHKELPNESLMASMPVNTRTRQGETGANNQVCTIMSLIHTDINDPVDRLLAIGRSTTEAKKLIDTPIADPLKAAGFFNPWLSKRVAKWYNDHKVTRKLPVGMTGVITNVMGPPFPLFSAGAKMVQYYCLGLLTPGGGIFQAVFSMDGTVSISVLSDREIMPDPDFYRQCIEESFTELQQAIKTRYKVKAPAKKKAVASKKKPAAKKKAAVKKAPVKKRKVVSKQKKSAQPMVASKAVKSDKGNKSESATSARKATKTGVTTAPTVSNHRIAEGLSPSNSGGESKSKVKTESKAASKAIMEKDELASMH